MTETMKIWNSVKRPPESALKKITGGRLSGMTNIKPIWRYETITELFGPCGEGWKYTIDRLWTEPGSAEQVMAFAQISFYFRSTKNGPWSEPIPGVGGSMLVSKETAGLHTSDEGYKMAVTDGLSVALMLLGVGAEIYAGQWDGSRYKNAVEPAAPAKTGDWGAQIAACASADDLRTVFKAMPADQREAWAAEVKAKRSEYGV